MHVDEALPHGFHKLLGRVAAHHGLLCVEHKGAFRAELAAHGADKFRRRAAEQPHVFLCDRDAERLPGPVQRPVTRAVFPVAQRAGAEALPVQHEDLRADPLRRLHIVFIEREALLEAALVPLEKQHGLERRGKRMHRLNFCAARRPQAVQKRAEIRLCLTVSVKKDLKQRVAEVVQMTERLLRFHRIQRGRGYTDAHSMLPFRAGAAVSPALFFIIARRKPIINRKSVNFS